jgi:hypothetical protein
MSQTPSQVYPNEIFILPQSYKLDLTTSVFVSELLSDAPKHHNTKT